MRPNHIWHHMYPTCRTWNLLEIVRECAEWQPGGLYMVAGGLLACQVLHICLTELWFLSALSSQRRQRVKRHFAQVQHKSPCRHLFFAHITAQPVLLPITFGLRWHFDSSLSVLSCSLNPCQLFFLAELSRFAKLWHVFFFYRSEGHKLLPVMFCAVDRDQWCQKRGRTMTSDWRSPPSNNHLWKQYST